MKLLKTLATHHGVFHTDELVACAVLRMIFSKIRIIRTRDPSIFVKTDLRVDVGRKYDPATNDYDHHQESFLLKRENGIPYASAGLIWKHFGRKLVNSQKAFEHIDKKIMQPIDALDNGMQIYEKKIAEPYTLQKIIDIFNPPWKEKKRDPNKAFEDALKIIIVILKKEIAIANSLDEAEQKIEKAVALAQKTKKHYILLEDYAPWKETVLKYDFVQFAVVKNPDGNWCVHAVPRALDSFESRTLLPSSWTDCEQGKLAKLTGIKDAYFCHKGRFIACARTKEGAVALAEMAVKIH
ncbi:MAG: hypothetical protein RL557_368 [archaeon]|jgi:uncharacterized UPF0160 family protein